MTIAFGTYELEARANWTLNLMLVAVGYKYMIGDSLPNLAYLTKIDEFVLISFAVLALSTMRHGLALINGRRQIFDDFDTFNEDFDYLAPRTTWDTVSFWALYGLYLLMNIFLFCRMHVSFYASLYGEHGVEEKIKRTQVKIKKLKGGLICCKRQTLNECMNVPPFSRRAAYPFTQWWCSTPPIRHPCR
jgi:hypothetical protein